METYNGYKNYCTWAVALWLDNEQGTYNYMRELAQEVREESDDTDEQRYSLQQLVKDFVEENAPELPASMYNDLFTFAMEQVDYNEIAEHILEE